VSRAIFAVTVSFSVTGMMTRRAEPSNAWYGISSLAEGPPPTSVVAGAGLDADAGAAFDVAGAFGALAWPRYLAGTSSRLLAK
jgi:hypothetical protein